MNRLMHHFNWNFSLVFRGWIRWPRRRRPTNGAQRTCNPRNSYLEKNPSIFEKYNPKYLRNVIANIDTFWRGPSNIWEMECGFFEDHQWEAHHRKTHCRYRMMSMQAASRSFVRMGFKPQQLFSARTFCAAPPIAEKIQVMAYIFSFLF